MRFVKLILGTPSEVTFSKNTTNRLHRHYFFEPCLVVKGRGMFECEKTVFSLQAGDLFIARPGQIHQIRSHKTEPLTVFYTQFAFNIANLKSESDSSSSLYQNFIASSTLYRKDQFSLISLFDAIRKLFLYGKDDLQFQFYHQYLTLWIEQVMTLLAESEKNQNLLQGSHLMDWIDQALLQPCPAQWIARKTGMTERTLRRYANKYLRHPLSREIQNRRAHRASQLLLMSELTISEVADRVGINDPGQFCRFFKNHLGKTPREFRQEHKKNLLKIPSISFQDPFQTEMID